MLNHLIKIISTPQLWKVKVHDMTLDSGLKLDELKSFNGIIEIFAQGINHIIQLTLSRSNALSSRGFGALHI
jgi:hypothetical protein